MTDTPPALPDTEGHDRPTHHEALLSTFIYPGAGQWVQGRKVIATIIIVAITCLFLWICWLMLRPVAVNFAALMEWGGKTAEDSMTTDDIMASLTTRHALRLYTAFGVVYLLNVIDVWWAYHRRKATS